MKDEKKDFDLSEVDTKDEIVEVLEELADKVILCNDPVCETWICL